MAELVLRPLSIGEALDRSLGIFRRRFGPLIVISLICTGFPMVLMFRLVNTLMRLAERSGVTDRSGEIEAMLGSIGGFVLVGIVFFVLSAIANAATVLVVSEGYLGRRLGAGEALRRLMPILASVILLALLQQVIFLIGGLAFIPASVLAPLVGSTSGALGFTATLVAYVVVELFLFAALFVSVPALVLEAESNPTKALGRSWALTRGRRLSIIGMVAVFGIVVFVLFFAMAVVGGVAMGVAGGGNDSAHGLGAFAVVFGFYAILGVLGISVFYCIQTVVYYDLRVRKEGFDLELLASTLGAA